MEAARTARFHQGGRGEPDRLDECHGGGILRGRRFRSIGQQRWHPTHWIGSLGSGLNAGAGAEVPVPVPLLGPRRTIILHRSATNCVPQLPRPTAAMDLRSSRVDGMARNGWTACRNHWTTSSEYALRAIFPAWTVVILYLFSVVRELFEYFSTNLGEAGLATVLPSGLLSGDCRTRIDKG